MIERLYLEKFRGFEDHEVPLRKTTILVGANNAGKSTIVEALRLIALVTARLTSRSPRFHPPPDWLGDERAAAGVSPVAPGIPAEDPARAMFVESMFHRYEPPASLTAEFSSGAVVRLFIGPGAQLHGSAWDPTGVVVSNRSEAIALDLDPISVQPQVAPLRRVEPALQLSTVEAGQGTHLAPLHFRNQLRFFTKPRREFKRIAEESWLRLQIKNLPSQHAVEGEQLLLNVRDGDFVGEVSLMGHGLQMWLQVVWFLARAPRAAVVILDEPDVYMHPDLQRRLLGMVRDRYHQLLVATHSIEIISDVDPSSILDVNRDQEKSQFVTSTPELQTVVSGLGTVQHIDLARLMRSDSFLLVEGEDIKILRVLQESALPASGPIDLVPSAKLGGRGGWLGGVPEKLPSHNGEGKPIRSYAILDRDYFPDDDVAERKQEAKRWKVNLHVWSRKELENFLLVPTAIARYIGEEIEPPTTPPSPDEVAQEIDRQIEAIKEDVILDSIAEMIRTRDRAKGSPPANKLARERVNDAWPHGETRWALAPGKKVLGWVSNWAKQNYGVEFTPLQIARAMRPDELDDEVLAVIRAIAAGEKLT